MTAINIVCVKRLNALFVVADAARYRPDGVAVGFGTKIFTVPHWPGVVALRGAAVASPIVGDELAEKFATFDELVDGIEGVLPEIIRAWSLQNQHVELLIGGWSRERGAPESYVIETTSELPVATTEADAAQAEHLPAPFTLHSLPACVDGPAVTDMELIIAANWEGVDVNAPAETIAWSMQKFIEIQRQAVWSDGIHWIGGFAQLATVTPGGVSQKILTRWPEDRRGELLKPTPIDWKEWHKENPKPAHMPTRLRAVH